VYRALTKSVEGGVDVHDDHDASTIKLINRDEFIYLYSEIYKLTTVNTHLDDSREPSA